MLLKTEHSESVLKFKSYDSFVWQIAATEGCVVTDGTGWVLESNLIVWEREGIFLDMKVCAVLELKWHGFWAPSKHMTDLRLDTSAPTLNIMQSNTDPSVIIQPKRLNNN